MRYVINFLSYISMKCHQYMIAALIFQFAALVGLVVFDWILGYDWYGYAFMIYIIVTFGSVKLLETYEGKDEDS